MTGSAAAVKGKSVDDELQRRLMVALERPHRLGMIGGDLADHLAHAAGFASVLEEFVDERRSTTPLIAGDLGTGGGVPGVVLAALHPAWRWTLIDVRSSRAAEVDAVVRRLGLQDSCRVEAKAAQEMGRDATWRESFDVLVARAFGAPPLLAECAAGLLRPGGVLVVSEPPNTAVEERWPVEGLTALGLGAAELCMSGGAQYAVIAKQAPTPDRFPRLPARERPWPKAT